MIELRPYQVKAIDDIAKSLRKYKRVVGWYPTASGKSIIIAGICQRIVAKNMRVLVLCHTAEILEQNNNKTKMVGVNSGIFCAGLKRNDKHNKVIHASRDSFAKNPLACGFFDVIIIDECHLVSENPNTVYQRIITEVQPKYQIGLTGTPWRMKGGRIFGEGKYWEKCASQISMQSLFDTGYLSQYVVPHSTEVIKTDNLQVVGGDFNLKQLTDASTPEAVIKACLDQWERLAVGRKFTMIFCCSIEHAQKVWEKLMERGYRGTYLTEKTNAMDRKRILSEVKAGKYDFLCNVAVLTTGVDLPLVDCILFLRATMSLSLWIQMLGRGLRLHESKTDCMMIDCGGNFDRLGRPEAPKEKRSKKDGQSFTDEELLAMGIDPAMMTGSAGEKKCPNCSTMLPNAAKKCIECGHLFINHTNQVYVHEDELADGTYTVKEVIRAQRKSSAGNPMFVMTYLLDNGHKVTDYHTKYEGIPPAKEMMYKNYHQRFTNGDRPKTITAKRRDGFWSVGVVEWTTALNSQASSLDG